MSRYAYCIFCDDIRQEVGHKMSMMGIYLGELHVTAVPVVLPKLSIATFCNTELDNPFNSLAIRVTSDGAILQESTIQQADLQEMQLELAQKSSTEDPIKLISVGTQFHLLPFVIEKAATLLVTVIADGTEMVAGKLRIKHNPNPAL